MAGGMGFDEVLALCLDTLDDEKGVAELLARYPEHALELEPLLKAAVWLDGQAAAFAPRPGFVKASRARLVENLAAPPSAPGSWLSRTLAGLGTGWRVALQAAVVLVMLACLVLGSTGIAYASQNALPGDVLYAVKLGLEQVELLVTLDPQDDLRLHLQFSQLRITEMQRLLALGRYDDLAIATAVYRYHLSQALSLLRMLAAQNPAQAQSLSLEVAGTFFAQADTLASMADNAPVEAQAELEAAEQAARDAAQQALEIGQAVEIPLPTDITGEGADPPSTQTPTTPPTATVVSFAMPSATPTPTPSPTATATQTRTPTPTRTPTLATRRTATATLSATARPNGTIPPTATRTSQPTPTRTDQPTPTRTSQPTPTRTGQPTPTRTDQPTPTRTGQPTPTLPPTSTATRPPATPTRTDTPPPTNTPRPTPTSTREPSPYPYPSP